MTGSRHPILPGAEPFDFPGRPDVGVLLVHGFTGSPFDMRPIGEALAERGIGSQGPLLRGHGTHPDDMVTHPYTDWIEDVERALEMALGRFGRVVIVGLSMGGTLALNVLARRAERGRSADPKASDLERVLGLVTLGSPLALDDWRLGFAPLISKVVKWQAWGKPDIKDRRAWDGQIGYRRIRTRAILAFLALLADTRPRLAQVRLPTLIVQSRDDHTVPPRNADLIRDGIGGKDVRVIMLDNCYHVSTVDFDAATVKAEVVTFVERLAAPAPDAQPTAAG